jgi:peroxiredoxin
MNILTDQMPLIQSYGTTLLFVTTSGGSDFLDRYHPNCNLVEDADFKISESFKLVYECPPKTRDVYTFAGMRPDIAHGHEGDWRLPVTATYIINEDGVIVDGRWYANGMFRMSVDEILVTLQRLHEEKQRKLALESHNSLLESVDL